MWIRKSKYRELQRENAELANKLHKKVLEYQNLDIKYEISEMNLCKANQKLANYHRHRDPATGKFIGKG